MVYKKMDTDGFSTEQKFEQPLIETWQRVPVLPARSDALRA
jgi:hypothetical protein